MEFKHKPVMLSQVLSGLNIKPDGIYLDCTLGGAGHSIEILKQLSNKGRLIGIDKDADAIKASEMRLKKFKNKTLVQSDFKDVEIVLEELGIKEIDGVLLDLGVSSYQLDTQERGFSIRLDAPLDMRMDKRQDFDAKKLLNTYTEKQLTNLLFTFGEEPFAKNIARNIIEFRKTQSLESTGQLKEIIENSIPQKVLRQRKGACQKTFQAIRIEVNAELEGLAKTIEFLISRLRKGGRIAIIDFHSLEDRIVKETFKKEMTNCLCPPKIPVCICHHKATLKLITKKPMEASVEEQSENPRSSCAKLRIAERI